MLSKQYDNNISRKFREVANGVRITLYHALSFKHILTEEAYAASFLAIGHGASICF